MYRKYLLIFCICILAACSLLQTTAPFAKALTMTNSNYILQMGNVNTAAGKSTGSGFKLNQTVGQVSPGLSTGSSYKVRAGFQYISSIIRFRLSISSPFIDFGTLSATNPVTRLQNLKVSNGSAHGYIVTASENHSLLEPARGAQIPDTTCDSGTCSETTSGAWTSNLTYGLGYRCDNVSGSDCTFTTANNYKQFANINVGKNSQAIMTGVNIGKNKEVQLTYKVNISATQPAGDYTNIINFIAIPTF